jgi:hypothetical protein
MPSRPDETTFPLRSDEFYILCDGPSGDERAGRDLYIGIFFGSIAGLAGLVATADWKQRGWILLTCFAVLLVMAAVSSTGWLIHSRRMRQEETPYSRLTKSIADFFRHQMGGSAARPQ